MELPPGRWAEYAISLPWDAARRGTHIRTDLLAILRGHELQRELVVRTTISWNARRFDMEIGQNSTRAEAALIFMTGNLMDVPCTYCQEGRGVFPLCVRSRERGTPGACANCWWPTPARRCSLEFTTSALAASAAFFQSSSEVLNGPQVRRALCERTGPLATAHQNLEVVLRNPASTIQEIHTALQNQMDEVKQFLASFQ